MALCCTTPKTNEVGEIIDADGNVETLHVFPKGSFGFTYEGEYVNGKRHGQGYMQWDREAGACGKLICVSSYEGDWENDLAHGHGIFVHPNGSTYDGEWQFGKAHGTGEYTKPAGEDQPPAYYYSGEWFEDRQDGEGVETRFDPENPDLGESRYEGQYQGGQKHGAGRYTFSSGDVYEGQFEDGQFHGQGRYQWAEGRVYEGSWEFGQMQGLGRTGWTDGSAYEGEYVQNVRKGKGCYTYKDGRTYDGEWAEGEQWGQGEYKTFLGVVRKGEFDTTLGYGHHLKWTDELEDHNKSPEIPNQSFRDV